MVTFASIRKRLEAAKLPPMDKDYNFYFVQCDISPKTIDVPLTKEQIHAIGDIQCDCKTLLKAVDVLTKAAKRAQSASGHHVVQNLLEAALARVEEMWK